jgi:hypothetical protein
LTVPGVKCQDCTAGLDGGVGQHSGTACRLHIERFARSPNGEAYGRFPSRGASGGVGSYIVGGDWPDHLVDPLTSRQVHEE